MVRRWLSTPVDVAVRTERTLSGRLRVVHTVSPQLVGDRGRMTRIVALLTAFVAVVFGVFIPATAASAQPHAYPPTICPTLAVSTTTPLEGQPITVSGVNFAPHTKLTLELHTQTYDL